MKPRAAAMSGCKRLLASCLLAACLLSGCVAFEHVPATLECDPLLAGRWIPFDEVDQSDIEEVVIDQDCLAVFPPPNRGVRESYRMTLRGFTLDEWNYLVFSSNDVERIYGLEADALAPLDEASFLLRYRVESDVLQGWVLDSEAALKAATDDRLDLRTVERDLHLIVGDSSSTARILRSQPALFEDSSDAPAVQLHRVSEASP